MKFKIFLIAIVLFFSGILAAQSQDNASQIVTTKHLTPLPEIQHSLKLASGIIIYDNGPLVNSPGTGVGGMDESVLQKTSLGMDTLGFGHQVSTGYRVADDFVVPAAGWNIGQIEFFAYETGETASTITLVNLQIWDGPPGQSGSQVVFGDTVTNIMSQTAPANILRVTETDSGADNSRQIAVSVVDVNINLPAGTYWLDWQSEGSGNSGLWAPPITMTGNTTTGNAVRSSDNGVTYEPIEDSGTLTPQGLPFIIYGQSSGATATSVPSLNFWGILVLLLLLVIFSQQYLRQ
ncbi:hypothetical protein [Marinicella gelatinilytica]|uniref:hypothetical protein n=1 Tax=Marinicella gelatinilytica TaxID=2996017 RepID=UPI00226095D9|nr:hypothetical protein [Marinicella gelatinilytica]MCX7545033.1 hypothetical protein [Marinicella gelatinilytica]